MQMLLKKDKIVYLLILTFIFLFIQLSLVSAEEIELAPEMERIKDRGKLIVGLYYEDMPPFFMQDEEGELYGVDIELARDIAQLLEVELEFNREARTYAELYKMVAAGEVDLVISKFSKTFDRARVIRYSRPYVTFRRALLVNSKFATHNNISDYPLDYLRAHDVKIGVKASTSYVEFAGELFPKAEIVQYPEWSNVLAALKDDEIVAAMYDENEVIKSLRNNSDLALYASVYILEDQMDYIAMALPRESTQLQEWLNFYLDNFSINLSVDDLIERYPDIYGSEEEQG